MHNEEQNAGWRHRGDEVALAGHLAGQRQREPASLRERAGVEDMSLARRLLHRDDHPAVVVTMVISKRFEGLRLVRGLYHRPRLVMPSTAEESHARVLLARHHHLPINVEADTSLEGAVERGFLEAPRVVAVIHRHRVEPHDCWNKPNTQLSTLSRNVSAERG